MRSLRGRKSLVTVNARLRWWAVACLMLATSCPSAAAKDEIWRQDGAAAFGRGKKENVVISDSGLVRLAPMISKVGDLPAERVWDLAVGPKDTIYAATGDQGRVYKRSGDGDWEVIYQGVDSQVFSLALSREGILFAGTGPNGRVVEIDTKGDARIARQIGVDVKYIWDLALAADGTLFAATGPGGQLWKRPRGADAAWELVFDSPQSHLLSLAVAPDGRVFVGSDGAGLIYEITAAGKASVVLDAPQDEIRVLRFGPDGALYAGTATPAAGSQPSGTRTSARTGDGPIVRHASLRTQDPGTARLKGGPAGENVVYRIDPHGAPREIFRGKVVIHALSWQKDRLIIGTGPEGQIFELRDLGRQATPIAKLAVEHVLALSPEAADGSLLVGTGDPGGVFRLEGELSAEGQLESEVFDTHLTSRFGRCQWRAETPKGTSVSLALRTGNTSSVDATWSSWQGVETSGSTVDLPEARYVQYRATLARGQSSESPALRSVELSYRTLNLPPEIASITVPDVSTADGSTRRIKLDLKWEASDPNDDELEYTLWLRKEDWPDWLRLGGDTPLTERQFSFDTTTVPAGTYRIKVVASDRRSNRPAEALERERTSEPFLVDHLPPTVKLSRAGDRLTISLADDYTRLVKAEYSLDGGPWTPLFPDDGLFDTRDESITLPLDKLKPGTHVIVIRATDAAGNLGSADVVIR